MCVCVCVCLPLNPWTTNVWGIKLRIQVPVRGAFCSHVGCFDLMSHLNRNVHEEDSRAYRLSKGKIRQMDWKCPICSFAVDPEHVFVDAVVSDILARTSAQHEVQEVLYVTRVCVCVCVCVCSRCCL